MYGLVPASAVALSPSFMMVAMLKSVRCACPVRKDRFSTTVQSGGNVSCRWAPPSPKALAAAHLAHPAECCRASRLCGRSTEQGGEARNAGGTGASHEQNPRSPASPLPGPQWESAQHWSGRAPEPRTQKQSPLAWAPGEGLSEPRVCLRLSWPPDLLALGQESFVPEPQPDQRPRKSCRNHVCCTLCHVGFCVSSCGRSYLPHFISLRMLKLT